MASATGFVSAVVFGRSVVVLVDVDPAARFSMWVATALMPVGFVLAWASMDVYATDQLSVISRLTYALSAVLFLCLAFALTRGTTRARLCVDNAVLDTVRWSLSPPRKLAVKIDAHDLEAEISTSARREITLFVDASKLSSADVL